MEGAFDYLNSDDRALLIERGEVIDVEKDHVILEEGELRRACSSPWKGHAGLNAAMATKT